MDSRYKRYIQVILPTLSLIGSGGGLQVYVGNLRRMYIDPKPARPLNRPHRKPNVLSFSTPSGLEERKRIRASSNRELRLQQAEQKKHQKEEDRLAKEANNQLQNDIKQARKGKKKLIMSSLSKDKEDTDVPAADIEEETSTTVNRRGRQIRLPQRFRDD